MYALSVAHSQTHGHESIGRAGKKSADDVERLLSLCVRETVLDYFNVLIN